MICSRGSCIFYMTDSVNEFVQSPILQQDIWCPGFLGDSVLILWEEEEYWETEKKEISIYNSAMK